MGDSVLGEFIRTADGRRYPDYISEEIFAPLGMDRAAVDRAVLSVDADTMTRYRRTDEERLKPTPSPIGPLAAAASGLIAAPREWPNSSGR